MKLLLTEANLTNFNDLLAAINKALEDKGVPQFSGTDVNKVKNWFLKKYVQAIKEDEVDLQSSIKPHKYKEGEPEWMNKSDIVDFNGTLPPEVIEEIGFFPEVIKSIPLESFVSDDEHFNFQTYICIVKEEFIPNLSNEHMGWSWCLIDRWPKPVHQGIKNTLGNRVTRAKVDTIFELLDSIL